MFEKMSGRAGLKLVLLPLLFAIPARSFYANVTKLGLISLMIVGFFLYAGFYEFPGGAYQFPLYAEALAHGNTLPAEVAQRDAGFPLLLLLSGYTLTGSFVPITLIHAVFAVLMPLLVYAAIHTLSRPVAFYTALCAALSLAPILFMKWIHHDQGYIFFALLMLTCIAIFVQTRDYRFLYFFTFAALAASLTRPAGNLLFPVFLALAYLTGSRKIVHYLVCVGIFVVTVATYQWHRHEIFNMQAGTSIPSYTGQQIFYNFYINSREYGLRLGPEIGPNMARITNAVHQAVQPNLRETPEVKSFREIYRDRPDFFQEHFLRLTPDQFTQRIYELPNWEYYAFMCAVETNDQVFLAAAWEIFRAHPLYVLRFMQRNMRVMLIDPGYAHVRFHIGPLERIGLHFPPDMAAIVQPVAVDGRAVREMELNALAALPEVLQAAFAEVELLWIRWYPYVVAVTLALMLVAWLALARALIARFSISRSDFPGATAIGNPGFIGSVIAASALLWYNIGVVSAFAEPDFRYHHFILLLRILIAGYGLFALAMILKDSRLASVVGTRVRIGDLASLSRSGGLKQYASDFNAIILLLAVAGYGLCVEVGPKHRTATLGSKGWPAVLGVRVWMGNLTTLSHTAGPYASDSKTIILLLALAHYGLAVEMGPKRLMRQTLSSRDCPAIFARLRDFDVFENFSDRKASVGLLAAALLVVTGSWVFFMISQIS